MTNVEFHTKTMEDLMGDKNQEINTTSFIAMWHCVLKDYIAARGPYTRKTMIEWHIDFSRWLTENRK